MKSPWQIWTAYLLCLCLAVAALAWLTIRALDLEARGEQAHLELRRARKFEANARRHEEFARKQAEFARAQAELQERASNALWRMDSLLTPLMAQEASRPYFVYDSFSIANGPAGKNDPPSVKGLFASPPLLLPVDNVLLYFQVAIGDRFSSPQAPAREAWPAALECGATLDDLELGAARLAELRRSLTFDQLLRLAPDAWLPPLELASQPLEAGQRQAAQTSAFAPSPQRGLRMQSEVQVLSAYGDENEPARRKDAESRAPLDESNASARDGSDFGKRNEAANRQAYNYRNTANSLTLEQEARARPAQVREGVCRPVWVGSRLLLLRRVLLRGEVVVQGCWLDWPRIRHALLEEVADLLPQSRLVPLPPADDDRIGAAAAHRVGGEWAGVDLAGVDLAGDDATGAPHARAAPAGVDLALSGRVLATLPVRLVTPSSRSPAVETVPPGVFPVDEPAQPWMSSTRLSLAIAWGGLAAAAIAVGFLLGGVMALSERRGAFVSAVTHELRTPLTTFRVYAEMLAEGMAPEESRQDYLRTLRVEADRLAHLVENVLAYARLERVRPGQRREEVSLQSLLDRVEDRLRARAAQADMTLCVEAEEPARAAAVSTDPAAVERILFNLVDNACKYAAAADDRRLHLRAERAGACLRVRVEDHGPGVDAPLLPRLFEPFHKSATQAAHTAAGVGLGLALSRRLAKALGGGLRLAPAPGGGACFELELPLARVV